MLFLKHWKKGTKSSIVTEFLIYAPTSENGGVKHTLPSCKYVGPWAGHAIFVALQPKLMASSILSKTTSCNFGISDTYLKKKTKWKQICQQNWCFRKVLEASWTVSPSYKTASSKSQLLRLDRMRGKFPRLFSKCVWMQLLWGLEKYICASIRCEEI